MARQIIDIENIGRLYNIDDYYMLFSSTRKSFPLHFVEIYFYETGTTTCLLFIACLSYLL